MYDQLRKAVCDANIQLPAHNLVIYSWGNVSGMDRSAGVVAIKPSGVAYQDLTPEKIVLLDLDGNKLDGELNPSSDTPTHLELYRNFAGICGVCHTHSPAATAWAQACREIPCFGTTHADFYYGPVPITDVMTEQAIKTDYERNTGKAIVKRFADLDPAQFPAVLVANHGPFTWGKNAAQALESMVVLEQIAAMALATIKINPQQDPISRALLDKHYLRKHGENAYYGQQHPSKQ
ncbi:MAG: L-ribulose-5-phosphate 4-epimerase AraD [Sedimentisphaerales bacterium]|nr:L-ribulose-5-phosphate 4-epimerase AraD [Sedimentisphaerales bacterium]